MKRKSTARRHFELQREGIRSFLRRQAIIDAERAYQVLEELREENRRFSAARRDEAADNEESAAGGDR